MEISLNGLGGTRWPAGLTPGDPTAAGLDPVGLERAMAILEAEIREGCLPGAVAVIARGGTVALHRALGWSQIQPERREMLPDTIFDLASLTKVMATLPAVLRLVDQGLLGLDDTLDQHLTGEDGPWLGQVNVRHLLTHTAGLPSGFPLWSVPGTRADRIRRIFTIPLEAEPGTRVRYSDLSFLLLGEVVQRLSGMALDRFVRQAVHGPLGFAVAGFNPPPAWQSRCAATEYRQHLGRCQCGEVHDENATGLGGVAGHAGLFATAPEVAAYGQMWLNGGIAGTVRVLAQATVAAATRDLTDGLGESRGLGWMMQGTQPGTRSCGQHFAPESFGHTGFTGTSLWVDPVRQLVIALMTNRVHLGRTEHILRIRPRFHDAVAAAVR